MKRLSLVLVLLLAACTTTVPVVAEYKAKTLQEVYASVTVEEFGYDPPEGLSDNQFPFNFLTIELNQPVSTLYADAVRRELTHAGSDVFADSNCLLSGDVVEFRLDAPDAVTSPKPAVTVNYVLVDTRTGQELFNETISNDPHEEPIMLGIQRNIDTLLSTEAFVTVAEDQCEKA